MPPSRPQAAMRIHRPHRRRQDPVIPPAPPKREDVERSRLLAQLEREKRRVASLDADFRSIGKRQEEIRRRARPTLPLSWLPPAPATHEACGHTADGVNGTTTNGDPENVVNGANGSNTEQRAPVRSNSTAIRSNSITRRDQDLDAHTQLALARLDETAAQRRIERAERLIKIQTVEGLLARLVPEGGEEGYDQGSEPSESVLTA
ncbi:hypothetical protein A1Q1_07713 [Trichosporon asahii var. asahii CBS 2479]|uniref:Uncharacterized protein n=1 Tax=Trichosporon asahii var. asahii (strain ATCC 90039 / CBS 2479 / JCM 2466 / KCTC 7840 / NBRC 103889/ NCYC 2677 / UAMH 7654) TaxID=1186058 RepID=J5R7L5_TRIAS|nr:hypothetical protein A1Q1_07713 [Trichosporon asahii var. asahii CBS 2479]EJT51118.1 hypothetical protein A1Q1_07713 [Trichosporon asahii var. asahii CBS 2479]